jgi:uncharacterized protein with PQ loop repeat
MQLIDVLGWIALVITVLYTGLGMPVQIRKNHRKQSVEGLSLVMTALMFATFTSWVVYAAIKPDWYLIGPNSMGAVCSLIVLVQFWLYRNGEGNKP